MKWTRISSINAVLASGFLLQSGGCQVSGDAAAVTIQNLSILAVTLVRGAILSPVDRFLTNSFNDFFDTED